MATRRKTALKVRTAPSHRRKAGRKATARPPKKDTLTLEKFNEFFREHVSRSQGDDVFPCQQEYLDKRRPHADKGDSLAIYDALQRCRLPARSGFSFEDARLNPKLDARQPVCEVPLWLVDVIGRLLWAGLHGDWPKGAGRHARAITKVASNQKDLIIAARVLKARQERIAWEDVFDYVSDHLDGAGTARNVKRAYENVAKAFREEDVTRFLFTPRPPAGVRT